MADEQGSRTPAGRVADQWVWDDVRMFLGIARGGSLTAAARLTGVGVATVSRRIERLEAALGVPLFMRHQSGYELTDDGQALMPQAEALESAAHDLGSAVDVDDSLSGQVRLATAENLCNSLILPALPGLLEHHPSLSLELLTDIGALNVHRRDADLAVRMVKPDRGNLTVRRLGMLGFGLYGAPGYLSTLTEAINLDTEADIGRVCRLIGWTDAYDFLPAAQWLRRMLRGRPAAVTTSSLASQLCAARAGLGLAVLPHFLAVDAQLQRLPISPGVDQPIWLVMHSDLVASRRVRVVANFLIDLFDANRGRLAGNPNDPLSSL